MTINNIDYEIGIYDLEGNFIDSTDDWDVLETIFGLDKTNVINYFRRNYTTSKIYQLVFKKVNEIGGRLPLKIADATNLIRSNITPVAKYYNNKLITSYKSISDASRLTGLNTGNIAQSCIKGYKVGIFNFKYIQ